jgi:hypothetical protein
MREYFIAMIIRGEDLGQEVEQSDSCDMRDDFECVCLLEGVAAR